ncbi:MULTISPECIES: DUF262 domain-containing protein [unclassified Microcoleus]|uniref:DUF262 domain-containing protein n=2 Tax=unclassified Microcoleus TaxID=2642155 RepID=UPI002FCFFA30
MGRKLIKPGFLVQIGVPVPQDGDKARWRIHPLSGSVRERLKYFIFDFSSITQRRRLPMYTCSLIPNPKFFCTSDTNMLPEQEIKMSKAPKIPLEPEITHEQREAAEVEIREKRKVVDYDTKEYPVEVLVQKYTDGLEEDTNELYIPDYQREMIWPEPLQSKFIESILLGLPIPYIFVADLRPKQEEDEDDLARLEIVDGTQRIRTLDRFLNNELKLCGLEKLKRLNNFKFNDLPLARQRRFNRATIRMIVLTEKADEETRRDLFERINTGSVQLNDMEKRRGISLGPFVNLLEELSKDTKFRKLCPFSDALVLKREPEEFVLRFFPT